MGFDFVGRNIPASIEKAVSEMQQSEGK